MFSILSKKLSNVFENLKKRGVINGEIIEKTIRALRISLLEADVALPVVRNFINSINEKLKDSQIAKSISPVRTINKYVYNEIIALLGQNDGSIIKNGVVLMCGLQGAGKTTTTAKLANMLSVKSRKKVLLVSTDTNRPAAIDQLRQLAETHNIAFFDGFDLLVDSSIDIAKKATIASKNFDITIFDTSGRMYVAEEQMVELQAIKESIHPNETFLVIDCMMGQDALKTAQSFHQSVPLTGLIMTKADGDARGGACLSARFVTNCQIRYMCTGEKIEDIETFYPERIAARLLGEEDIDSFVENIAPSSNELLNLPDEKVFSLDHMKTYLKQAEKICTAGNILKFFPQLRKIKNVMEPNADVIKKQISIIDSMTPKERKFPKLLNASRKKRIAAGSGWKTSDVNTLLKKYEETRLLIRKMDKSLPKERMRN
jgi:signal recognition particle subunit SRP54